MSLVLNALFPLGPCGWELPSSQTMRVEAIMEPQQCQYGWGSCFTSFSISFLFQKQINKHLDIGLRGLRLHTQSLRLAVVVGRGLRIITSHWSSAERRSLCPFGLLSPFGQTSGPEPGPVPAGAPWSWASWRGAAREMRVASSRMITALGAGTGLRAQASDAGVCCHNALHSGGRIAVPRPVDS